MRPGKFRPNHAKSSPQLREDQAASAWSEGDPARNSSDVDPDDEVYPAPHLVPEAPEVDLQQVRILVVDDQLLVRAGLCQLVNALPNVAVVGEASDGREALRLIGRLAPDMILMDIAMPGMNGLEALVLATTQFPQVRVIILSEHANEEFALRAVRAGAAGYVVKDDTVGELHTAIKLVAGGGKHISPQLGRNRLFGDLHQQPAVEKRAKILTPRQLQILQHVAQGNSTKEIASLLGISVNTVKTHRLKLMEKLGVHEISGLVRYAAKLGLINN